MGVDSEICWMLKNVSLNQYIPQRIFQQYFIHSKSITNWSTIQSRRGNVHFKDCGYSFFLCDRVFYPIVLFNYLSKTHRPVYITCCSVY